MPAEPSPSPGVTQLLHAAGHGDAAARDRLFQTLYAELHGIAQRHMRRERVGHTLQATGLVSEAALRLLGRESLRFEDREHFLRAASLAMRRVLVDHARARNAAKRDGRLLVTLNDELDGGTPQPVDALGLDRALTRLAAAEPRWAQVVELRFLLGLEVTEVAEVLGTSTATVKRDWRFARAWLARELEGESVDEHPDSDAD